MLHVLSRYIEPDIKKADELYVKWINQTVATQEKSYKEALAQVGIPPSKE